MKYPRKTIYFKANNVDLYEYLESKGKQASDYICKLIREDMERDNTATEQLILEEIQRLREDLKQVRLGAIIPPQTETVPDEVEEVPKIEIDEQFDGLLLSDDE